MESSKEGYPTGMQQQAFASAWRLAAKAPRASLRRTWGRAQRGPNLLTSHFGTRHVEVGV